MSSLLRGHEKSQIAQAPLCSGAWESVDLGWGPRFCISNEQEMWVQALGGEDPLEKEMATLSSILAWKIPWTEEPGGLQSMESQRIKHELSN